MFQQIYVTPHSSASASHACERCIGLPEWRLLEVWMVGASETWIIKRTTNRKKIVCRSRNREDVSRTRVCEANIIVFTDLFTDSFIVDKTKWMALLPCFWTFQKNRIWIVELSWWACTMVSRSTKIKPSSIKRPQDSCTTKPSDMNLNNSNPKTLRVLKKLLLRH